MEKLIQIVNQWNQDDFVRQFGDWFEKSPWVAERVWALRPFESVEQLLEQMVQLVIGSSDEEKLVLLRNHPDLGSKLAMSKESTQEQKGVGLDQLSPEAYEELDELNKAYIHKFDFPFIMAVKGQSVDRIISSIKIRLYHDQETEFEAALQQVIKIASFRMESWKEKLTHQLQGGIVMNQSKLEQRTMYYGKGDVWVYRSYAKPLTGVYVIPASPFEGRDNVLFGMNIKIAVKGEKFLASFEEGDNSLVVATDSMKNFILRHAGEYEGATMEGLLEFISRRFLETYPQMTGVQMTAEQINFDGLPVAEGGQFKNSDLVFRYGQNEHATAAVELERKNGEISILNHFSGAADLKLIKVKGSSFAGFVRDEYTTLPETTDRPLFIFLNIGWRYADVQDGIDDLRGRYVAAEQIRDLTVVCFHEQNSPSIQNLIYRIGQRILSSFPQLEEVWFESNNRTWETVVETIDGSEGRVFTEPRPPYGFQGFSMTREDLPASDSEETGELIWQEG